MTRTHAPRPQHETGFTVSHPHDPAERQAHQAADVVARGGSVAGWSFGTVRPSSAVHREESAKPAAKKDDTKEYQEAATTTLKALLETESGKKATDLVLSTPLVKKTTDFITTPIGLGTGGLLLAGGLTGLAAAKQPLPFQLPAVPLEKVHPSLAGITGQVVIEGPLNAPTFVGVTFTFGGGSSKDKKGKEGQKPVQREPSGRAGLADRLDTSELSELERTEGSPLEPAVRRRMESRFGYDFGQVRIHEDGQAHRAAAGVEAHAFTVGRHIAFAPGRYDPRSYGGEHLLAHELAHVVQQQAGSSQLRRGSVTPVQRVGIGEALVRFFGGGTFTPDELLAYLRHIRSTGQIEDAYDSDNKARDIVRRFLAHEAGFTILTVPDRVLLIREMLSGFTGDDDERAILSLLQEALPSERLAIVGQVGESLLNENFHGDESVRLRESIDSGRETQALAATSGWTVRGVLAILSRHGDDTVVADIQRLRYQIIRFDTAFDHWQYDDGHREEVELTDLRGNTRRDLRQIRLRASLTDEQAARTLFHEMHHATSPATTTDDERLEDEIAARVVTEQFNIRHGFPPTHPRYRRADGSIDEGFIRRQIRGSSHYNPTGRRRIGRRYVGESRTSGWVVPAAGRGRRGRP